MVNKILLNETEKSLKKYNAQFLNNLLLEDDFIFLKVSLSSQRLILIKL